MSGCCLVSFHFLCYILCSHTVGNSMLQLHNKSLALCSNILITSFLKCTWFVLRLRALQSHVPDIRSRQDKLKEPSTYELWSTSARSGSWRSLGRPVRFRSGEDFVAEESTKRSAFPLLLAWWTARFSQPPIVPLWQNPLRIGSMGRRHDTTPLTFRQQLLWF